ncbi:DUF4190 domain-containing protein [Streptomyces sp. NBC_01190]|uniref:DUF4190 domain-containing protein n=1 Tax=Streptomyces sp. NBC_01190 TaxID=2903767 RepID=UPI003869C15E|nr:DUF4190 domain-containing protein [Streptomyces sp. NBC_01190]
MDIPPPPPPSSDATPSPDGTPPPAGPPSPPEPPPSPAPHEPGSPYGGLPTYPQGGYGTPPPYAGGPSYGSPPYPGQPYAGQPYPGYPGGPYPGQYSGPQPGPFPGQQPGPYPGPPYGPPAYGYPPQAGWYAERPTNGLAIAALVTALVICIPLLGLVLGVFALRQVNRRGDRGKAMAVAAIVISSVTTLLIAALVALGAAGAFDEGNTRVADLVAGQCFNTVNTSLSDYDGRGARSTTVDVVPCDHKHDAEAYKVFAVDATPDGGYPGVDTISDEAGAQCNDFADEYLDGTPLAKGLEIYYYMPPEDGWNRGDRDVTCFFGSRSGKVTGSARNAGDGGGFGV